MSTLKTHKDTPLKLLDESQMTRRLGSIAPTLKSVRVKDNLLTLTFKPNHIIRLPLTTMMTWGQLTNSLKEKGLIHESN